MSSSGATTAAPSCLAATFFAQAAAQENTFLTPHEQSLHEGALHSSKILQIPSTGKTTDSFPSSDVPDQAAILAAEDDSAGVGVTTPVDAATVTTFPAAIKSDGAHAAADNGTALKSPTLLEVITSVPPPFNLDLLDCYEAVPAHRGKQTQPFEPSTHSVAPYPSPSTLATLTEPFPSEPFPQTNSQLHDTTNIPLPRVVPSTPFDPDGHVYKTSILHSQLKPQTHPERMLKPYLGSLAVHSASHKLMLSFRLGGRMCNDQAREIIHATNLKKPFKARPKQQSKLLIFFITKSDLDPG
ncbi:hypothetical protein GOP47_0015137 [Adiantum capillus-veneris]|uniref:Uncharacterized protein n=1 Tax=Adiantum capillus-veneris TaxID=13818 RepID=A0A9D4ZD29_ADICA|nr:hypothetical protein GOP47_0015137 [Adiantum capillus-veneris]